MLQTAADVANDDEEEGKEEDYEEGDYEDYEGARKGSFLVLLYSKYVVLYMGSTCPGS
jgi:hypothetical protein